MTEATGTASVPAAGRTPWHLWLVGVIALLWNGFAAYDCVMTLTVGEAYLRQGGMTDPQIAYWTSLPTWMVVDYAVGVWVAVLGAVLLLLRKRLAFACFLLSLLAFLINLVYFYLLSQGSQVMGQSTTMLNGVILAGCLLFAWYSRRMSSCGVLR